MEVVGNRFSWQHQRLFYPRGVPGLWDPAHRCGCPKFACTQGKQDELMEKSFSGDYEMLSHLQSLLVTRHHLKNLSGLMLRSAALNVEKKREKNRLFCFALFSLGEMILHLKFGNRNLQWKDKCYLTLYIWAWCYTLPTYFPSSSVPDASTHGESLIWVKAMSVATVVPELVSQL